MTIHNEPFFIILSTGPTNATRDWAFRHRRPLPSCSNPMLVPGATQLLLSSHLFFCVFLFIHFTHCSRTFFIFPARRPSHPGNHYMYATAAKQEGGDEEDAT